VHICMICRLIAKYRPGMPIRSVSLPSVIIFLSKDKPTELELFFV
jgi:hypothetical protein